MARNKRIKKKRIIKEPIDVLWLVLVVMLLIISIRVFTKESDSKVENLKKEAEKILSKLTDNNEYSLAPNNIIREEKLERILEIGYIELKNSLNVKNDFCIYFEDENSNLIKVNGMKTIGSSAIKINGEPCGG